jgi:hypothetical protein
MWDYVVLYCEPNVVIDGERTISVGEYNYPSSRYNSS